MYVRYTQWPFCFKIIFFYNCRDGMKRRQCVLCGKNKKKTLIATYESRSELHCQCVSIVRCHGCAEDMVRRSEAADNCIKPQYQCPTHGNYRQYQDNLIHFKNWCIVWVTIAIIPLGMLVFESGIDLNWIDLLCRSHRHYSLFPTSSSFHHVGESDL